MNDEEKHIIELKGHTNYLNSSAKKVLNKCHSKLDMFSQADKEYIFNLYKQGLTYVEISRKAKVDEISCIEIVGLFLDGTLVEGKTI